MVVIASGVALLIAAFLFTQGILKVNFDANLYQTSVSAWASLLISAAIMPFLVFTAFAVYQETIVNLVREIEQQRDTIAELAGKDQLTGLPMAKLTHDRLQMKVHSALRSGARVAVMFVDLNGFKHVNDTWGHDAGDELLRTVAARLRASVRGEDTVGRVGGDEFVVILGKLNHRDEAIPVAEKIVKSVCEPVVYNGQSLPTGVSIGISIFPEDAADLITLRRLADRAMYQVKRSGKCGFAFADNSPLSDFGVAA
jgi:diguanylate cyclase (GGDEF)-like protein